MQPSFRLSTRQLHFPTIYPHDVLPVSTILMKPLVKINLSCLLLLLVIFLCMRNITCHSGTPTLGGRRGSYSLCLLLWGAGGARIVLHTEPFPFILSYEGALFDVVDSSV